MIIATVFVDWDTARRLIRPRYDANDIANVPVRELAEHIESCFSELQAYVVNSINKMKLHGPVKIIKSRIYHGWHRGKTKTPDRAAWEQAAPKLRSRIVGAVSYLPDIAYGNELLCGGNRSILFDTLRERDSKIEQKMVDTALTADLLSYSRTESRNVGRSTPPSALAVIIGDDDDLIPGAIVSEAWGIPTHVLRVGRDTVNKHLSTNGLIVTLSKE